MIFYLALDENGHRQLRGTQADARGINKQFEQIDIPTDKAGLMAFVQDLFDQIGAGVGVSDPPETEGYEQLPAPTHAAQLLSFDDEWENFPLPKKAHYASLFCEEARARIKP